MRKLLPLLAALLCCFSLFCVSSSGAINVHAIDSSQTVELTADQWYSMIGTPDCYYLGTDQQYHSITPTRYTTPPAITSCNVADYGVSDMTSRPTVWLRFPYPQDYAPNTSEPYYPIIRLDLDLHFSNVTYCDFGCGSQYVSSDGSALSYATQNVSVFRPWFYSIIGDHVSDVLQLSASRTDSGIGGTANYSNGVWSSMNAHKIERQTATDLYFGDIYVAALGAEPYTSSFYVILTAPILNAGYQFEGHASPPSGGGGGDSGGTPSFDGNGGSSGTVTGTITDGNGNTQDINVSVEEDNSGLVSSILSGIKNLFVPSDEDLAEFSDDMQELAENHLGGLYEAVDLIHDSFAGIDEIAAQESLHVDEVTIPLLRNQNFKFGNWDIPLKPSNTGGFGLLYTSLAYILDFLFAAAFLNMCHNKLDFFLNPSGGENSDS